MTENEKQLVQQVTGAVIAASDMSAMIVHHLVRLKTIKPSDGLMLLMSLHGYQKDLQQRNSEKFPGQATVYGLIADRLQEHIDQLKPDTGAKAVLTEQSPDGSTRSREI